MAINFENVLIFGVLALLFLQAHGRPSNFYDNPKSLPRAYHVNYNDDSSSETYENVAQNHHGYRHQTKDDDSLENDDSSVMETGSIVEGVSPRVNSQQNVGMEFKNDDPGYHPMSNHQNSQQNVGMEFRNDDPGYHPASNHQNKGKERIDDFEDEATKRVARSRCILCCRHPHCAVANDHICDCFRWDKK